MAFKSSLVSSLFGLMSHLALHKMVEGARAAGAAAMSVGEAGSRVYPAALLGAPLVGLVEKYFNNRQNSEELADLYRESLPHAIETCVRHNDDLTDEDRRVVKLWEEGLKAPVKGDPLWQAMLEENLPTRMSVPICAMPQSAGRFSEPSLSGGPTGSIKTKGDLCRARKQQS
jgi:hypothetical protein